MSTRKRCTECYSIMYGPPQLETNTVCSLVYSCQSFVYTSHQGYYTHVTKHCKASAFCSRPFQRILGDMAVWPLDTRAGPPRSPDSQTGAHRGKRCGEIEWMVIMRFQRQGRRRKKRKNTTLRHVSWKVSSRSLHNAERCYQLTDLHVSVCVVHTRIR